MALPTYDEYVRLINLHRDYAKKMGASPQEVDAYTGRLNYVGFGDYGGDNPEIGWANWRKQAAQEQETIRQQIEDNAYWRDNTSRGTKQLDPIKYPDLNPAGTGTGSTGGAGGGGVVGGGGGGAGAVGGGTGVGGVGGAGGGGVGGGGMLPGYGISQILNGFGIPGHETNPMVGGGSWEGTTWNGAPYSSYTDPVIPNSDTTNPNSPYYRPPKTAVPPSDPNSVTPLSGRVGTNVHTLDADAGEGGPGQNPPVVTPGTGTITDPTTNPTTSPTYPKLAIDPAIPYQTSWYLQTYNGKRAPWENIHQQLGDSMKGIQAAKPGFNWASPEALSKLGGVGMPLGWTSMLGFTPGGKK